MDKKKQNFINTTNDTAINSYGELFSIGDNVGHEDKSIDENATIQSFEIDKESEEVKAITDKGYAHIDFIHKLD